MVLPDLLKKNLCIVFCGMAAGNNSADRRLYYAKRGNMFYVTLFACRATPKLLTPEEYPLLLDYNIGLTDLAKFAYGPDKDIKITTYDILSFENKILRYQPKFVCFNGKEAAKAYLKKGKTIEISYGIQEQTIGNTKLYVAPSTSRMAMRYWDEDIWKDLFKLK